MQITNCTWKFQFQCPRRWESLRQTGDPNVRICESCLEDVHLCADDEEVRRRSESGQCVALGFHRDSGFELLGRVIPVD